MSLHLEYILSNYFGGVNTEILLNVKYYINNYF